MRPGAATPSGPEGRPEPGAVVFDRYRLLTLVGSGSTSTVWKAHDELLHETVALKRIPFAHLDPTQARLTRDRTLREARLAAKLRHHPHVVAIYDILLDTTDLWLVTEYLPARSLRDHLATHGPLHPTHAATIGAHIADALAAAHDRGITHRDIKPANVMLTDNGTVKLTDFGIAHHTHLDRDAPLTAAGTVSGTVAYMAPETARTGHTDPTTDIYSLGATLYTAVEGTPPYGYGTNDTQLLHLVSNGIIRPPTPGAPLTPLLHRLLQTLPTTRPDAHTTRDLLHRHTTTHPHDEPLRPQLPVEAGTGSGTATQPWHPPDVSSRGSVPVDRAGGTANTGGTGNTGPSWGTGPSLPTASGLTGIASGRTDRLRRRLPVLVAALVAVVLVVTVVSVATRDGVGGVATTSPFTGAPALPASVPDRGLEGPPSELDLCPLLPTEWFEQYGPTALGDAYRIEGCEAVIQTQQGTAYASVRVDDVRKSLDQLDGDTTDLGGVGIARPVGDGLECGRSIWLSDDSVLYVQAQSPRGGPPACRIAETAVGTAVSTLAERGVSYRPGRAQRVSLADVDACDVSAQPAFAAVPGLVPTADRGYGGWSCHLGPPDDAPSVSVDFRLSSQDPAPSSFGTPVAVPGTTGYQNVTEPADSAGFRKVAVTVVHRPHTEDSSAELVIVTITTREQPPVACAQAVAMLTQILPALPTV